MAIVGQQTELTLEIKPHPQLKARQDRGEVTWIVGTLKLSGELPVHRDFNSGELLVVSIADEDGQVIASGHLEVEYALPKPIEDKDLGVIGTERIHKTKVVDVVPTTPADEATA